MKKKENFKFFTPGRALQTGNCKSCQNANWIPQSVDGEDLHHSNTPRSSKNLRKHCTQKTARKRRIFLSFKGSSVSFLTWKTVKKSPFKGVQILCMF